jgi:serine phosphatase RsbU (regulator of sigma subunit)
LLAIPVALIVLILAIDDLVPNGVHLGPLLAVAPAIAALFSGPRATAAVGLLALLALVAGARLRGGLATLNHEVQVISLVAITGFVVVYVVRRERRGRELAQVRSVSEAVQRVVLRPVPPRIGPLRIASLYLAAAAEARIGGDLYAAARTDGATRLLIGDVRGKGLAAISDAAALLCAFREAAHRRTTLPRLVDRLEASVARNLMEAAQTEPHPAEFFITAALAEVPDDADVVRLVVCGHPPPLLLLRGGEILPLRTGAAPPLGMGDLAADGHDYTVETFPFAPGDRLVLYTDGVIEARNGSGTFYPLAERLASFDAADPPALAGRIRDDLLAYVGGRLPDDAAVVVAERG